MAKKSGIEKNQPIIDKEKESKTRKRKKPAQIKKTNTSSSREKKEALKSTKSKTVKTDEKGEKEARPKPMRKRFLWIISIIVILCIIGFLWFILTPEAEVVKAQLIIDSGTVQVKHPGESWKTALHGMFLSQSDSIRTGNNSSAAVVLFESSIIRLVNNTEITLQELIQQAEETSVTIQQSAGRTWNTILNISGIDNYEVQTPTTIASVRGTSFDVLMVPKVKNPQADYITIVGVGHGTVIVSSMKNGQIVDTIEVHMGQAVTVDPDTIDQLLQTTPFEPDNWVLTNQQKDDEMVENVKGDLYDRLEPHIREAQRRYRITDQEIEVLIDSYLRGYFDLPPDTPDWIREIIELS